MMSEKQFLEAVTTNVTYAALKEIYNLHVSEITIEHDRLIAECNAAEKVIFESIKLFDWFNCDESLKDSILNYQKLIQKRKGIIG